MSYYYTYTLTHPGLGRSRVLRAASRNELQQKADAQLRIWNDLYAQQREANARRQTKANKAAQLQEAQNEADARTREAQETIASIRATLLRCLREKLSFSWDDPRNRLPYQIPQPEVAYHEFPPQPQATDAAYTPHFGLLDKLVGPLHEKKIAEAQRLYDQALADWENNCAKLGQQNDALEADYLARVDAWKRNKYAFEHALAAAQAATDLKQQRLRAGNAPEVIEYNTKILEQSTYPGFFEKNFDLEYNAVKRVLTVNYDLPAYADFPSLDSVKYVKAKDSFSELNLPAKEVAALYASFLYQVCLRTLREIFTADVAKVVNGVAFNGYVSATNPATGNVERTCILALNSTPGAFALLNLSKVEAEECFNGLGGRGSDPLHKYRPVLPADAEQSQVSDASGWVDTLKHRISEKGGAAVFQVKELQQIIGSVPGARASLGDSRNLVNFLSEGGFSIEPDASLLAQGYRSTDAVAVYVPNYPPDLKASVSYQGAVAVLAMCGLVAVADGNLEPSEVVRILQCVEQPFNLSAGDKARFGALLNALIVNGDCLWRALPKFVNQLRPEFKEWAVEVAVYVGIKNGALEPAELKVLNRIFQAIDLPDQTTNRIIAKYTVSSTEVTVLNADPHQVGEAITNPSGGLKLDMSRVAEIARETKELVDKLSDIMDAKEAKAETSPVVSQLSKQPVQASSSLNANYLPLYRELISQSQWSKADFIGLAAKYNLMPVAVVDVINGWADDALGDFLIEGEDPVTIHLELQPQPL